MSPAALLGATSERSKSLEAAAQILAKEVVERQDSPSLWETLVDKRNDWSSFFEVKASSALRSQLPGSGSQNERYASWSSGVSLLDDC